MAQNNDVRTFVKESLRRYYRYQQYKMKDNPNPGTDLNLAVKIDNNLLYVNGVGGYNGNGIINSETIRPISAVIADAANVSINDNIVGTLFVWSSQKTSNTINSSISDYTYNKKHIDIIENTTNNVSTKLNNVSTRLNDTSNRLYNTNTKLNNVSTRLNDTNTTLNNVSTRLNDTNTTLNNVSTRLNDVSNRLYNTNTKLNNVSTKLDNVSTKLDSFKGGDNISINNGAISALGYTDKRFSNYHHGFAIGDTYAQGYGAFSNGFGDGGAGGTRLQAIGTASFVSGYSEGASGYITTYNIGAHAEGYVTNNSSIFATGYGAHAEGYATRDTYIVASGAASYARGYADYGGNIVASGGGAHAEGVGTTASGEYSCAFGKFTIASQDALFVCGQHNKNNNVSYSQFIVGIGTSAGSKKNGFEVLRNTTNSVRAVVNNIENVYLGSPIGSMVVWAGSTTSIPSGWLLCNGKVIVTQGTNSYTKTIGQFNSYLNLLDTIGRAYGCDTGHGTTMNTVDGRTYYVSTSESFVRVPNATVSIGGTTQRYIIKYL